MPAQTDADKGERIDLPSGLSVFYVDKNHSYWRCNEDGSKGKRLTGVTTAIKPIDFEADGLMKWAARLNAKGIAELVQQATERDDPEAIRAELQWLDPNDLDRIWLRLAQERLTYEDIREAKGVVGTNIHEIVLRDMAAGQPVPSLEDLTDQERGYAQGVIDFWLDHSPEPLQVEQIVADEELGIAGRYDLRGRFAKCSDPFCPCHREGVGLIDCKTGTWTSEKDHVQIALYSYLAEKCGLGHSDWTGLLHVTEAGTYRLWEGQATEAAALAAVGLYRHRGLIRNRAGKERKLRS